MRNTDKRNKELPVKILQQDFCDGIIISGGRGRFIKTAKFNKKKHLFVNL